MLTTNDVARVYDAILSIPGMNDTVKIDLRISRKNVLLLKHGIERGLVVKDDEKNERLLSNIPDENLEELKLLPVKKHAKSTSLIKKGSYIFM